MSPVHDYVIDNSTGANVRADINSVLQAILSNNSNSSAPSTTAAYMWWADTTTGILKIRNSANNAWVELLQLDGTLTLEDGSVSAPALAFRDDLNTGVYSSAADTFDIATAGIQRLRIDSSGRLLLGTTTEGEANADDLTLASTGHTGITIRAGTTHQSAIYMSDGTSGDDEYRGNIIYDHDDNHLRFATNAVEALRIDSSQNVGIGITSPAHKLHIDGNTNDAYIRIQRSGAGDSAVDLGGIQWRNSTNNLAQILCRSVDINDGVLKFSTMGAGTLTERMIINSSGYVGIGTGSDTVDRMLHVKSSGLIAKLESTSETSSLMFATPNNESASTIPNIGASSSDLTFTTGNSTRLTINSSGNVGIGTTAPTNLLDVRANATSTKVHIGSSDGSLGNMPNSSEYGISLVGNNAEFQLHKDSSGDYQLVLGTYNGSTDIPLVFRTGSRQERMRITNNGNVGIGTISPNDKLVVVGAIAQVNTSTSATSTQLHFDNDTSGGQYRVRFDSNGSVVGSIQVFTGGTAYNTTSDYRLKENITAISDGITRLKTLKPSRFNFKIDKDKTVDGFIAHEVTAVPEAISGTKDEVATEDSKEAKKGDPIYQQIDQSKLVPLLVAAVQELITKVETLEAA